VLVNTTTLNTVIVPAQEAFLVDTRDVSTRPNRWIEAQCLPSWHVQLPGHPVAITNPGESSSAVCAEADLSCRDRLTPSRRGSDRG
jgi:hypothetical protein